MPTAKRIPTDNNRSRLLTKGSPLYPISVAHIRLSTNQKGLVLSTKPFLFQILLKILLKTLNMVDNDIASHNSLATIGFCAIDALLAKTLNRFAQYIYGFCGRVTAAFFFYKLLHLAGDY